MLKVKYIALITLLFFSFNLPVTAQINVEEIVFDREVFDFGTVDFGPTPITATFIFTNNSSTPFEIRDVLASCGCTVPSWPNKPILPGMKGVITAKFDPANLGGEVDKSIEIFANYNRVMSKVLHIKGIIKEPVQQDLATYVAGQLGYLRLSNQVMGFGTVFNNQSYTQEVLMVNDYNLPLNILEVAKKPDYLEISFSKKEVVPGDTIKVSVTVHGGMIKDFGLINDKILFGTTDVFFETKLLNVAMDVQEDFSKMSRKDKKNKPTFVIGSTTYDLGPVKKGAKKSVPITIKNTGKTSLKIHKIKSDCSCTLINNLGNEIPPGGEITASLTFDSIFLSGKAEKEITLFTNDPDHARVLIKVYADVIEH